ncbi:MAG: hypothetical protein ACI9UK_001936 [Candidatus Krumholzibacteriia bacterium]|jgi:hypothetical protein
MQGVARFRLFASPKTRSIYVVITELVNLDVGLVAIIENDLKVAEHAHLCVE